MVSQIGGGNGGGGGETSEEEEKKEHASLHSLTRRRRSSQPKIPPLFSPMQAKTAADEVLQNPEEEKGEKGVSEAIPIPFLLLALAAAATR